MKIFKSETLGEQLEREAKEKAELKNKFKEERERNEREAWCGMLLIQISKTRIGLLLNKMNVLSSY